MTTTQLGRRRPLRHGLDRRLEHGAAVRGGGRRALQGGELGVDTTVGAAGTSGGFEKFCAGETDISDASRPIEPEEEKLCQEGGVEYTEVQVANDGIAIVTNPEVAISCLTTDQLEQLWEPDSKITNYSQLGNDADTGEALPDVDVSLYGPGTDSGRSTTSPSEIDGEEGASRDDYQPSEDDNVLVQGVSGDRAASVTSGSPTTSRTRTRSTSSRSTTATVASPRAPRRSRTAVLAAVAAAVHVPSAEAIERPEVDGFMNYVVDNYDTIAEAALIVPMDETQAGEARTALDGAPEASRLPGG